MLASLPLVAHIDRLIVTKIDEVNFMTIWNIFMQKSQFGHGAPNPPFLL